MASERGTEIAIAQARGPSDFDELSVLLQEYEAGLEPELRHHRLEMSPRLLAQRFTGTDVAFVARVAGRAAGCVMLVQRDPATGAIHHLFVRTAFRGSGAGRALVNSAIARGRERGYDRIVLDTHAEKLVAAYRLYRDLGFVECTAFDAVDYACPTFMELRLV
jgi:ribosomal protein S18 acetylase RimI-like enzyme